VLLVAAAALAIGAWIAILQESGWRPLGLRLPFGHEGETFHNGERRALERVLREGGQAQGN